MGPRQSTANPVGSNTGGGTSSGVRTGATNSALVNNFGDYATHDAAVSSSQTPRPNTGSGGAHQHLQQHPAARSPAAKLLNEDGAVASSQSAQQSPAKNPQQNQQQNQPAQLQLGQSKSKMIPLCLRYKYQPNRSGSNAPQGQSNQRTVPLPPPPHHGIAVDLFDGDGKHIASLPLVPSEGEFFAVVDVPAPAPGEQPLTQYFRFVVDGHKGVCHPHLPTSAMPGEQPIVVQQQGPDGQMHQVLQQPQANFVQVFGTEEDSEVYNNAKQQQSATSKDAAATAPVSNNVNNIINDEEGWSQVAPVFEETRKFPPIMPPHLRYTPLNAPPTQVRVGASDDNGKCTNNGTGNNPFTSPNQNNAASSFSSFSNTSTSPQQPQNSFGSSSNVGSTNNNATNTNANTNNNSAQQQNLQLCAEEDGFGPAMLEGSDQRPAPLSVTINHVYFQKREDHTLVGITTRFQDKCTSIAYYKHDPLPAGAVPLPMPLKA
jgi:hypothetical protein